VGWLFAPGASGAFLALFGLVLGSYRARTARAVVADRRGSFGAPCWRLPLATGTLPRPNLSPRCRQLASVRGTMSSLPLATGTLPRPNPPRRCRQVASVSSDILFLVIKSGHASHGTQVDEELLRKITMLRTERQSLLEASERLRRAMIRNFFRSGPGPPESFSMVWAGSRQLADTNGMRGGGRPPRVVRSTGLELAPGNGYAPAAKPAAPLSAAGQRLERRGYLVMKNSHASYGTYVWRSWSRSQRTSQASDDEKLLSCWAPGARLGELGTPGASGVF
jgi:hypothetical protein